MRRLSYNRNYIVDEGINPTEIFMGEKVGIGQYYANRQEVIADFYATNEKENLRNIGREYKAQLDRERVSFSRTLAEECEKDTSILQDLEKAITIVEDKLCFWMDVAGKYFDLTEDNWFEKARYSMELMFSQSDVVEACIRAEGYSRAFDDMTNLAIYVAGKIQSDCPKEDEGIYPPELTK
jgi:hypothetical protein